ncbi:hypothetical protein K502DRAFT_364988 [Neoconidiobolus thromboides FSU 785]|nr:hypothetical protein K502DRAFT_364988 [Neoconidiobolus thromboides FSU 785]
MNRLFIGILTLIATTLASDYNQAPPSYDTRPEEPIKKKPIYDTFPVVTPPSYNIGKINPPTNYIPPISPPKNNIPPINLPNYGNILKVSLPNYGISPTVIPPSNKPYQVINNPVAYY